MLQDKPVTISISTHFQVLHARLHMFPRLLHPPAS
jgi:hypothetical protein